VLIAAYIVKSLPLVSCGLVVDCGCGFVWGNYVLLWDAARKKGISED
jgi:hypothetical protein